MPRFPDIWLSQVKLRTRRTLLNTNCLSASFEIMASMDPTQNPCQDFYQFTCGKFMNDAYKNNKPSPYLTQILRNVDRLNAIISEEIRGDENDALLLQKRFYQACMNVTDIDDDANMQIKDLLEQIGGWPILKGQNWPETEITLMDLLLKCKNLGLPFQWLFEIKYFVGDLYVLNPKITKQYNESFKESAYQSLMVETAVNLGASRLRAFHEMQAVLDFEKQLEELVSKANKLFATNTNMDKLHNIFPKFSWSHFINNLTEDVNITMMENDTIIASEAYLLDLNLLLAATQKRVQINYVVWKIIQEFSVHMASPVRENFANFTNFMLPEKDQTNSRFKICIKDARARFPHVAELEFAALYSDEEKSRNVKEIIRNVKNQFISRLEAAYWIDEETKKLAVNKVEHIVEIVGYHKLDFDQEILEKFIGTTDLEFTSDNIIDMVREKNIYDFRQKFLVDDLPVLLDELSSVIFKQVFGISAAYSEHTNVIVFTAGTLQDTLYSEDRPKYLNYGALGSIIGHEIAHGFTKNAFAHDSEEEQLIIKGWFNESLHEISKLTFLNTTELWTNDLSGK
ncbi:hypothetical protein NQ318_006376 [Aromia moschata]|uniref:Peptidase M13 N-terminal domain-containing protein n=1 Tax=Aromia moschata TaxID=1265417 RepID=A0AAV8YHL5_9CUCU|nr:hypothetical protein NQ318_006376 [Aromia moschata]